MTNAHTIILFTNGAITLAYPIVVNSSATSMQNSDMETIIVFKVLLIFVVVVKDVQKWV